MSSTSTGRPSPDTVGSGVEEAFEKWADLFIRCRGCKKQVRRTKMLVDIWLCTSCEPIRCELCATRLEPSGYCESCDVVFLAKAVDIEERHAQGTHDATGREKRIAPTPQDRANDYVAGVMLDDVTEEEVGKARAWEQAHVDNREQAALEGRTIYGGRKVSSCRRCHIALSEREKENGVHDDC